MEANETDIVHVRGVVDQIDRTPGYPLVHISFNGGGPGYWASSDEIMHVEPRPIDEGDTVKHAPGREIGPHQHRMEVWAVRNGYAWCRSGGYDYIIPAGELERVP